jgi:hypothetical protein
MSHGSTSHRSTLPLSERLTFSSTYVYGKDEWALPGNRHGREFVSSVNMASVTIVPALFLSLIPSASKGRRNGVV